MACLLNSSAILKLKMLEEEKIKRASKAISYNLDKLREEVEELRKKLNDLEQRVANLVKIGNN